MPRSYADMSTLISTKLADTALSEFIAGEINYQIEESLKEFSIYHPHLLAVSFNLESRSGTDVTGTASKLTDSVKAQFLAADATEEKVIHNTTDNTWAVVLAQDSTSILGLSSDIMDANEKYEIYNKRCRNQKQIYLGDMREVAAIYSVEYPLGTRRNWKLYGNILEVDVDYVPDSDSTLTTLSDVAVLVRFVMPHILSQLTDLDGTFSATAAAAATSIALTALQSAGTIEEGQEFTIENHRSTYVIVADVTIASNAATVACFPPLESAVASTAWAINFVKSSLMTSEEEMFASLATGRLMINKSPKFANAIPLGGGSVVKNYYDLGDKLVEETIKKLRGTSPPKTKRRYPTD